MDLTRYHNDHQKILDLINALRTHTHAGVAENATSISMLIVEAASFIKLHLAAENNILYPQLSRSSNPALVAMGQRFQHEMHGLSESFAEFVQRWRVAAQLAEKPDIFRDDANTILKALFLRLQHENAELYPALEAI